MTPTADPRSAAIARAEEGRSIATAIHDAIVAELPKDAGVLYAYAHRLHLCNHEGNIWSGYDLHNAHGEAYAAAGRFWSCNAKLCPYCLAKRSKINRNRLRKAIELQRPLVGEHYHFLTLTMPNNGLELLHARHILNVAWSLFRKMKWFRETIIGGAKSEEFTLTKRGYHYHAHALVLSRRIDFVKFRYFWTKALETAFRHSPVPLQIATVDGLAMANCRRVGSLNDAINEVAKYITKTTTWAKIPPNELLDICRVKRFPRMFEIFGSFRTALIAAEEEEKTQDPLDTILDTECVSDGDDFRDWRESVKRRGLWEYIQDLNGQYLDSFPHRKAQLTLRYPAATFRRVRPPPVHHERVLYRSLKTYEAYSLRAGAPIDPDVHFFIKHAETLT